MILLIETIAEDICVEDKDTNTDQVDENESNNEPAGYLQVSSENIVNNVLNNSTISDKGDSSNKINNNCDENNEKNVDVSKQNENISNNDSNTSNSQQINIECIKVNGATQVTKQPSLLSPKRLTYCNVCSFVTMYPSDLTRHMRKHTGLYYALVCESLLANNLLTSIYVCVGDV